MGVGGYDTWSERSHPISEHNLLPSTYSYKFNILPIIKNECSEKKTEFK
jgi:hypothetical protein